MHYRGLLAFVPETKEEDVNKETLRKEIYDIIDKYVSECNQVEVNYNEMVDTEWKALKNMELYIAVFPNGTSVCISDICTVDKTLLFLNGKVKEFKSGWYKQTRKSKKVKIKKTTYGRFFTKYTFATNYLYLDVNEYGDFIRIENPNAQCDYADIGGRFSGFLLANKGYSYMSEVNDFLTEIFGNKYRIINCYHKNIPEGSIATDIAKKSDIDWELNGFKDTIPVSIFITKDDWIEKDNGITNNYDSIVKSKIEEFPDNAYFAIIDVHQ